MPCAYCGRRTRLAAAATATIAPRRLIVGELGLAKVRYVGDGRLNLVGAETDHPYTFLVGEPYAWVDKRDIAGFLEFTVNDVHLFEAV
jgi:hypothetical protein